MPEEVEQHARKELQAPRAHARGRRRVLDGAHLPRLADRAALVEAERGRDRHRARAPDPRRGPLRPRQDQAAHPRVPRGAQAQPEGQEPDPVLRRPARRRQDLARPEHRARDRAASSCARASAACTTRPRSAATAAPTSARCPATSSRASARPARATRCSCSTRWTSSAPGFHGDPSLGAARGARPRAEQRPSATTTSAVPFDLSQVMFIGTANVLDAIPGPLRDRMEVIELPGYTEDEKLEIARRYLVKRQLEANGLKPEQAEITDEALRAIVRDYTREAGVRNLERADRRGAAQRRGADRRGHGRARARSSRTTCTRSSARARFESEVAMRTSVPGVATGLAWTPVGGDILFVEATPDAGQRQADPDRPARRRDEGERAGGAQPGQVARRASSASTTSCSRRATSTSTCRRARSRRTARRAGVAMFTALASLLTDQTGAQRHRDDRRDQLRGLVLPVGGIKEKVLAAHRAGHHAACCCRRATGRTSRTSRRARATRSSSSGSSASTTRSRPRSATRRPAPAEPVPAE